MDIQMTYRDRQRAEADVPQSDKLMHAALTVELETFVDATSAVLSISSPAHWLIHDEHGDDLGEDECGGEYCGKCAEKRLATLDARHPAGEGEGWFISGGCDMERGPSTCGICGDMLDWNLDDSTAPDEMYAMEQQTGQPITDANDVYSIHQLADWAQWLDPTRLPDMERVLGLVRRVDVRAIEETSMIRTPEDVATLN